MSRRALQPGTLLRRLVQFRIRTLLLVTLAAAIGVKWYLRPEATEQVLPGGLHVKTWIDTRAPLESLDRIEKSYRDRHGCLLARVRRSAIGGSAAWTYYHLNGRKRLRGTMRDGCRYGVWTSWDENGVRRMEITYGEPRIPWKPKRPFVGQFGGGFSGGSFGSAFSVNDEVSAVPPARKPATLKQFGGGAMGAVRTPPPQPVSNREGAFRRWYADGRLQCEGWFENDRRHGEWTFYDGQGGVVARGEYRRGARWGWWRMRGDGSDTLQRVYFASGRRIHHPRQRLLETTRDLLAQGVRRWQALERADKLGPLAAPALAAALEHGDDPAFQAAVLQALGRLGPTAQRYAGQAASRTQSSDRRIQREAWLALASIGAGRREESFRRVLTLLPDRTAGFAYYDVLRRLADLAGEDLATLEVLLYDDDSTVRLAAAEVLLCCCDRRAMAERIASENPMAGRTFAPPDWVWNRRPPADAESLAKRADAIRQRMKDHPDPAVAQRMEKELAPSSSSSFGGFF